MGTTISYFLKKWNHNICSFFPEEKQNTATIFVVTLSFFLRKKIRYHVHSSVLDKYLCYNFSVIFLSVNIALVDDKEYGMEQIKKSLPSDFSGKVKWFSSAKKFLSQVEKFDIVFLDFYLDEDGITGDSVLSQIRPKAKYIIGFSSIPSGNKKLLDTGADFAILKNYGKKDDHLENILLEISAEHIENKK